MALKTLFISDLHLDEKRPNSVYQFEQLLKQCDASVNAVYILGDFFDAWIGDDYLTPFNQLIIQMLKAATDAGTPIYFLYGNHDFLLGKKFMRLTGCQLLPDEGTVSLYGQKVLLMHGDTLCTGDAEYQKARKIAKNRLLQFLFLMLPLKIRKNIEMKLRTKSAKHKKNMTHEIMDVTQQEVERVMKHHNVHYLIHGHTHRPAIHQFKLNEAEVTRFVLGPWYKEAHVLVWNENGTQFVSRDVTTLAACN